VEGLRPPQILLVFGLHCDVELEGEIPRRDRSEDDVDLPGKRLAREGQQDLRRQFNEEGGRAWTWQRHLIARVWRYCAVTLQRLEGGIGSYRVVSISIRAQRHVASLHAWLEAKEVDRIAPARIKRDLTADLEGLVPFDRAPHRTRPTGLFAVWNPPDQ